MDEIPRIAHYKDIASIGQKSRERVVFTCAMCKEAIKEATLYEIRDRQSSGKQTYFMHCDCFDKWNGEELTR